MATFSMCRILNNNNQGASDESGLSRTTCSVYLDSQTRQDYTSSQYLLQVSVSLIHGDINTKNKSSLDSYANS